MTRQIDDLFRYKGIEYAVCGISEGEVFDPWSLMDVGPTLFGGGTACWRGYQAVYGLADSQLVLDELGISLYDKREETYAEHVGPPINGVSPTERGERASFFNNYYTGLGYRLDYTGGLLLGEGFIRELYIHMRFHPAWSYTNVVELVFDKGVLVNEFDRSEPMAELRKQILEDCPNGDFKRGPTSPELRTFVMHSRDRAYKSVLVPLMGLDLPEPLPRSAELPRGGSSLLRRIERRQQEQKQMDWLEPVRLLGRHVGDRPIEQCEAALQAAHAEEDRVAEAYALMELGGAYLRLSDAPRAVDYYQQALAIAREIGDRQLEGASLSSLGNTYFKLPDFQQAKDCHEQALEIARKTGDRVLEALHLGNLATTCRHLGEASRAIDLHRQALTIARETGSRSLEANQLGNLGTVQRLLGRVEEAVKHHEEALAVARGLGDRKAEGEYLGCLGNDYLTQGEADRAVQYYEDALAIAQETGDRENEANWTGGLGNAIFAPAKDLQIQRVRLRDLPQLFRLSRTVRRAMPLFVQAADIARAVGDRKGEGIWLGNLGSAYHRLGRMRQAIPYYEQALAIAREVGDHANEAGWLRSLANAYGGLKEPERALEYYDQALAVEGSTMDPQARAILLYNMGLRAKQAGDLDRAREIWAQALALSEPMGFPIAAKIRRMLAELSD
jgi:tetratricopeptide (TPR) repeat protein